MRTIFKQIKLDLTISYPEIFEHKTITNSRRQRVSKMAFRSIYYIWRSQLHACFFIRIFMMKLAECSKNIAIMEFVLPNKNFYFEPYLSLKLT